jgi:hypothetical protein
MLSSREIPVVFTFNLLRFGKFFSGSFFLGKKPDSTYTQQLKERTSKSNPYSIGPSAGLFSDEALGNQPKQD